MRVAESHEREEGTCLKAQGELEGTKESRDPVMRLRVDRGQEMFDEVQGAKGQSFLSVSPIISSIVCN